MSLSCRVKHFQGSLQDYFKIKNPFVASVIQVKAPLKKNGGYLPPKEGFIFCLTPVALTKSLICVSNSWLNKEANPVSSKAKHLDYPSLNISFKHSAWHIPENSRARCLFKATFIKCKSLFVSVEQPCWKEKSHVSLWHSRQIKAPRGPSDRLIGPWPILSRRQWLHWELL